MGTVGPHLGLWELRGWSCAPWSVHGRAAPFLPSLNMGKYMVLVLYIKKEIRTGLRRQSLVAGGRMWIVEPSVCLKCLKTRCPSGNPSSSRSQVNSAV